MKIIITEEQNDKLNQKIISAIEKLGLEQSIEILGDNVIKIPYINNPSSFLDQFNNLTRIEIKPGIYYVDEDGFIILLCFEDDDVCFVNYTRIWLFFEDVMKLQPEEIEKIIKPWLEKRYQIYNVEVLENIHFNENRRLNIN